MDVTAPLHPSPGKPQPPAPTPRLQDPRASLRARGPRGPTALLPAPGTPGLRSARPLDGALAGDTQGPQPFRSCLTRRGPRPQEKRSWLSTAMSGLPRSGRKCAREGRRVREPQVGRTGLPREPTRLGGWGSPPPGSEPRPLLCFFVL